MTDLIRAELLKIRTTRMVLGLLVGALLFCALNVVAQIFAAGTSGSPPLTEPVVARTVYSSVASSSILALVLGILAMTGEYRHMSITATFLGEPRRGRLVAAKMVALGLVGIGFAIVCIAFTWVLISILLPLRDHAEIAGRTQLEIMLGALVVYVFYAVVGVGVGALIRNQIAAILIAIVWTLLVESLFVALLPAVGKWLPAGAAGGITQAGSFTGGESEYLPVGVSAAVLLAWGIAFAVLATFTTLRRDVT